MTQTTPAIHTIASPPIAHGRTADVYQWDNGTILKLYHDWFSLEDIQYEARIASAVHASGLPVPRPGEIILVGGRNGLIYERVDGLPLFKAMQRKPWRLIAYAHRQAALHAQMHTTACKAELPAQRQRLENRIQRAKGLPEEVRSALLARLAALPVGESICHGDFHPGNILLTERGAVVIDWIDATLGNPLADVARSTILVFGAASSGMVPRFMTAFINLFQNAYLREYFRLRPGGKEEYRQWLPVVAAARLDEGIAEMESWLVAQAKQIL